MGATTSILQKDTQGARGNLPRLIILITLVGYMFGRLQTIMVGHSSKTILHYRLAVQFPCICPLDFAALLTLPPRTELETCCTKLQRTIQMDDVLFSEAKS